MSKTQKKIQNYQKNLQKKNQKVKHVKNYQKIQKSEKNLKNHFFSKKFKILRKKIVCQKSAIPFVMSIEEISL